MEIYLKQGSDTIRFPVIPSSIPTKHGANIDTSNIIKFGEVAIFGGKKLKTFELVSFFPNQQYSFCSYKGFAKPYEFVDKITKWLNNGLITRLIVTGTSNNFECIISDFEHIEQDGTRDVYFTLSLIEYRRIEIPKYSNDNGGNKPNPTPPPTPTQKTHIVKKGDNLWDIAKKYYGKGSDYPKIKEKNKKTYPSLSKNNIIYPNWKLLL